MSKYYNFCCILYIQKESPWQPIKFEPAKLMESTSQYEQFDYRPESKKSPEASDKNLSSDVKEAPIGDSKASEVMLQSADNDSFAWAQPSMDVVQFDESNLFSSQIPKEELHSSEEQHFGSTTDATSMPPVTVWNTTETTAQEAPREPIDRIGELQQSENRADVESLFEPESFPAVPQIVEDILSDYLEEPVSDAFNEPVCTAEPEPEPDFGFKVIESVADLQAEPTVKDAAVEPLAKKPRREAKKPEMRAAEAEHEHVRHSARARTVVKRLTTEKLAETASPAEVKIPNGAGLKLADMPEVAAALGKKPAQDETIVLLHRLIWGRPGAARLRKAHLRAFNGFPADHDSSVKSALEGKLAKLVISDLKELAAILHLDLSGAKTKEQYTAMLASFLIKPDLALIKGPAKEQKKAKPAAAKKGPVVKKSSKKASALSEATVEE